MSPWAWIEAARSAIDLSPVLLTLLSDFVSLFSGVCAISVGFVISLWETDLIGRFPARRGPLNLCLWVDVQSARGHRRPHGPPSTAAIRRRFPSHVIKKTVEHPSGDKGIYRKAFSYCS